MKSNVKAVNCNTLLTWVHDNYEDAIHSVFYDGGYIYAPDAGPCEPLEVLREEFPNADPNLLEEAAEILRTVGGPWVNKWKY